MKQSFGIIQSEEDRSHDLGPALKIFPVAKTADHAVRASVSLYLLHSVAATGLIRKIEALRDDTVASTTCGVSSDQRPSD